MRQLILTGIVVTALGGYTVTSGLAQGMKIPGETATQSNIVKPRFARPFGLAVAADGSLLLGDEQNGVLYRIYKPE